MTDRVNALTVVLEKDIRIDDVQSLISAIRALRFVADVQPNITELSDWVAESRANQAWREAILKLCEDGPVRLKKS